MAQHSQWVNPANKNEVVDFSVGDTIRVHQLLVEGEGKNEKERIQVFEGMVIAVKGKGKNKSVTVRKIGANLVGVERIWPLNSPSIKKVELKSKGTVRRSKLYYTRTKTRKELRKIVQRGK